jgi:enamine deaminase RidA (YjgF/YER057c/UK114 family)
MPITQRLTDISGVPGNRGYAHAVTVSGSLAFVSGQVALDEAGNLVGEGDVVLQTRQALRNLGAILDGLGATWSDVVRFNWYLVDIEGLQAVRDVRDEFLRPALGHAHNPASSLIQVAGLFRPDCLVEVDAVVALP